MKKLLWALLICILFLIFNVPVVCAEDIYIKTGKLMWDQPEDGGEPNGYYVHYDNEPLDESSNYTYKLDVGDVLEIDISVLSNLIIDEDCYVRVSAYNDIGEGGKSNEANFTPVDKPTKTKSLYINVPEIESN